MRNHRKVKMLRNNFGQVQGYAFWSMMLEILTESDGNEFENSEMEMEMFAAELGVAAAEIKKMIEYSLRIELLFEANGFIYSESLNECLAPVWEKRKMAKAISHAQKRRQNGTFDSNTESPVVSTTETPQSKVEYSKVNKSKVDNTNTPPFFKKLDEALEASNTAPTALGLKETFNISVDMASDALKDINTNTAFTGNTNTSANPILSAPTVEDSPAKDVIAQPPVKTPITAPKAVVKGVKDDNPVTLPWTSDAFTAQWAQWNEYKRKERKGNYRTPLGENAALAQLKELSTDTESIAIKIIQRSIANSWQGLFTLPAEHYTAGGLKGSYEPKNYDYAYAEASRNNREKILNEQIAQIEKEQEDAIKEMCGKTYKPEKK